LTSVACTRSRSVYLIPVRTLSLCIDAETRFGR